MRAPRLRRPLAALSAALATGLAVLALRPPPVATVRVLAAARDLPSGTVLSARDLRPLSLPPDAVPAGALRANAVGRTLAGPMRRGEPLTDARLLTSGLLRGYGANTVATPIRIADAGVARLLRPGDRIDVLTTPSPDTPFSRTVVSSAPVVAVPRPRSDQGALIVLATDRPQAAALAAAGSSLSVTISGAPADPPQDDSRW
ncbi:SAF domain-containing protein [Actinomadura miaoliensis]|uniref:SAF domain-containing protein n=1 Tax=Actinomadura miaoliensis TaxID=430685 RepID=A0ABP7VBR5_9ACTN